MKFIIFFIFFSINSLANEKFKKVVTIVFENTSYETALKDKYLLNISKEGLLLTNFRAVAHPSLPNYVSMIAGTTFSIRNDDVYNLSKLHLGDLLESHGRDWRVYAEDYPGKCYLSARSGKYVRKHVPFLSFTNVTTNAKRCEKIQDLKKFFQDAKENKLKEYSMIVPNLDSDGHDTGIAFASIWFKKNFDEFIHSNDFPNDLLFIITFDEGMNKQNSIYTLLLGKMVKSNTQNNQELTHYSILKLIEENFNLGNFHLEDELAKSIDGIWK